MAVPGVDEMAITWVGVVEVVLVFPFGFVAVCPGWGDPEVVDDVDVPL